MGRLETYLEEANEEQSIEPSALSRRRPPLTGESFYSFATGASRSRSLNSNSYRNFSAFNESISYASFAGQNSGNGFANRDQSPPAATRRPSIFTTQSGKHFIVEGDAPPVPVQPKDLLRDSYSPNNSGPLNSDHVVARRPIEEEFSPPLDDILDRYQVQSYRPDRAKGHHHNMLGRSMYDRPSHENLFIPPSRPGERKPQLEIRHEFRPGDRKPQLEIRHEFRPHHFPSPPILEDTSYNNTRVPHPDYLLSPPPPPKTRLIEPFTNTAIKSTSIRKPKEEIQLICFGNIPRPHETKVRCQSCHSVWSVPKLAVLLRCKKCNAISPASHHT